MIYQNFLSHLPIAVYLFLLFLLTLQHCKGRHASLTRWTCLQFLFFFFFNFILFLNFTQLYQFCQISKWIRHRYTCVPHPEPSSLLPPHSIPGGRPRAPAPSIQYRASNLDFAFNFTEENGTLHERNPSFPNVDTFPSKWILSVTGWVHWEADSEKELNIQEIF